jgi:hypothetical protein
VIRDNGLYSARDETSCGSSCRMMARGSSYHSPIFCLLKREGEEKGWVLGCSLILWLLPDGWGQCMFSGGFTIFTIVSTLVILKADKGVVSGGYRLQVNRNSDCRGTSLYRAISSSCNMRD